MKRTTLVMVALGFFLFAQMAQAGWNPVKRLTWSTGETWFPAIAVDSAKTVHVVWEDSAPGNKDIFYANSTDGGTTWSPAKSLASTPDNSYAPSIAVDSSDAIHVVWGEYGPYIEIYYTRSMDGGGSWSQPKRMTWTSWWSGEAKIAIAPDGGIHVVWEESPPGNNEIYYRRSTDGGTTWMTTKRLTWTSGFSRNPAVAAGNSVHIVWSDDTPGNTEVYYRRSTDGGASWEAVKRLTWTPEDSYVPDAAFDSSGRLHVVWKDEVSGSAEIFHKRSTDGGTTWSAVKRLTWTAYDSYAPTIAGDSDDNVRLVWHDSTPGNYEIYYKSGAGGAAAWGPSQRVTWTLGESLWPAIAVDSDNMVHLVWQDDVSGDLEIYYRKGN
jgi:hypothetical protein